MIGEQAKRVARDRIDAAKDALGRAYHHADEIVGVEGSELSELIGRLVAKTDEASATGGWDQDLLSHEVITKVAAVRLGLDGIVLEDAVSAVPRLLDLRDARNELDSALAAFGLEARTA